MKKVDTFEYVSVLRELTEEGRTVSMLIAGNSMSPYLIHRRDYIWFQKPRRELRKGDMVFYQRSTGQFVMHRICKVCRDGTYDIVGDSQTEIEHGISRQQIFALVVQVQRKGRPEEPGSFWWNFFEKVWIRVIPLRPALKKAYGAACRLRPHRNRTSAE